MQLSTTSPALVMYLEIVLIVVMYLFGQWYVVNIHMCHTSVSPGYVSVVEIDWEHPGMHRGNLIIWAGNERVTAIDYAQSSDIRVPRFPSNWNSSSTNR